MYKLEPELLRSTKCEGEVRRVSRERSIPDYSIRGCDATGRGSHLFLFYSISWIIRRAVPKVGRRRRSSILFYSLCHDLRMKRCDCLGHFLMHSKIVVGHEPPSASIILGIATCPSQSSATAQPPGYLRSVLAALAPRLQRSSKHLLVYLRS